MYSPEPGGGSSAAGSAAPAAEAKGWLPFFTTAADATRDGSPSGSRSSSPSGSFKNSKTIGDGLGVARPSGPQSSATTHKSPLAERRLSYAAQARRMTVNGALRAAHTLVDTRHSLRSQDVEHINTGKRGLELLHRVVFGSPTTVLIVYLGMYVVIMAVFALGYTAFGASCFVDESRSAQDDPGDGSLSFWTALWISVRARTTRTHGGQIPVRFHACRCSALRRGCIARACHRCTSSPRSASAP